MDIITITKGDFIITTDQAKFDFDVIHDFIAHQSYWAECIPYTVLKKSIANSFAFGLFHFNKQIGFARVITDFATFGYLADVFVLPAYRGQGLSKWMMEVIMAHPELQGFRRWGLATRDAHDLYKKFGFTALSKPERMMEKVNPDIYKGL